MKLTGEQKLMTVEDKQWLLQLFEMRKKSLFPWGAFRVFAILSLVMFWGSVFVGYFHDLMVGFNGLLWAGVVFANIALEIFLYLLIAALVVYHTYNNSVLPYKLESEDKYKYEAKFLIQRKEYFKVVDEYFIYFPELEERGLQVTADEWNNCIEGEEFTMYITGRTQTVLYPTFPVHTKLFYIGPIRQTWGPWR